MVDAPTTLWTHPRGCMGRDHVRVKKAEIAAFRFPEANGRGISLHLNCPSGTCNHYRALAVERTQIPQPLGPLSQTDAMREFLLTP